MANKRKTASFRSAVPGWAAAALAVAGSLGLTACGGETGTDREADPDPSASDAGSDSATDAAQQEGTDGGEAVDAGGAGICPVEFDAGGGGICAVELDAGADDDAGIEADAGVELDAGGGGICMI